MADGTYTFVFRLYDNSTPTIGANCNSNSQCWWEETDSLTVTSGVFQVDLGAGCAFSGACTSTHSGIDFSVNNSLYLTMNFNGDTSGTHNGYMYPVIHMNSVPYARYSDSSGALGGIAASGFVQLGQSASAQTDASNNPSVFINKSSGTGNIFELQKSTADVLTISNTGTALFANQTNNANGFQVQNASAYQLFNINTSVDSANMITNGSFEASGSTAGWTAKNGSGTSTLTQVGTGTIIPYIGVGSMQDVTTGASSANAGASYSATFTNSHAYTFTLFARSSGSNISSGFQLGNSNDNSTDTSCLTSQTVSTAGWTRFTCGFTYTGTTGTSYVYFKQTIVGNRTFYVDAVKLEDSSTQTAYRESTISFEGVITQPAVYQNSADSTIAFQVLDSGSTSILTINTRQDLVNIGSSLATSAKLRINNGSTGLTVLEANQTTTDDLFHLQNNGVNVVTVDAYGHAVFKNLATQDSATAFQIQNSGGNSLLTADTSGNQILLGTASALSGVITFNNISGSGTASITLAANPTASYTYQLPTGTVGSGQCLQSATVSGTTVPLTFGACGTGSGANFALSNLAGVAINTSLLPASDNSIDLGDGTHSWRNLFIGTSIQTPASTDLALQPINGVVKINTASQANQLRVYENSASPAVYLSLSNGSITTSSGNLAIDTASSGTLTIGGTNAVTTIGRSSGTFTLQGDGSSVIKLTTGSTTLTVGSVALSGANKSINFPNANGTVCLQASSNCNFIKTVPTATENVIAPTAAGIIGLTVKGTTNASTADVLEIYNANASPTLQDYFDANGSLNVAQVIQPTTNNAIDLGTTGGSPHNFRTGYFGTSLQSPSYTGAAAVSLSSGGSSSLTLDSLSGNLVLGSNTTTVQKSATSLTLDVNNASDSTLTVTNAGSGVASLSVEGDIGAGSGRVFKVGATSGSTISACGASNYVSSFASTGGIITGGSCSTIASSNLSDTANIALLNAANTFAPTASNVGTIFMQTSGTATSGNVFDIQGANGTSHFFQIAQTAANVGSVALQSLGSSDLTLDSGSAILKLGSNTTTLQKAATSLTLDVNSASDSTLTVTNGGSGVGSLSVEGDIAAGSGRVFKVGATSGSTINVCGASNYISSFASTGGIISGGACSTIASSNLSDSSNIPLLNAANTFTNTNIVKVDSTSAFQVQNSSTTKLLNVDTTNMRIGVDVTYTAMTTPSISSVSGSAGSLVGGTNYYYKVTAIDSMGGETAGSVENGPNTGSTGYIVTWGAVSGASAYRVYRGTSSNGENVYYSTISTSFTDTGTTNRVSASPPSSTTAYTSVNNSNLTGQLSVGGLGSASGQLYVGGVVPSSLVGEINGFALAGGTNIYSAGRYVYEVDSGNNRFHVLDVSNPAAPSSLFTTTTGLSQPNTVVVQGHYAYVSDDGNNKLLIYNVINPASPSSVTSTTSGLEFPKSLNVQGRYAYTLNTIGSSHGYLAVTDISNPASPITVGTSTANNNINNPAAMYVKGNYAYILNGGNDKIVVFNISNPTSPSEATSGGIATAASPFRIKVQGRYAYVISLSGLKLQVFDVSNPTAPSDVSGGGASIAAAPVDIEVQGRYAYVLEQTASVVQIFDISNPASPTSVGSFNTSITSPNTLGVQGRYLYTATGGGGFETHDLGGAYIQSLEAGSAELSTLQVNDNGQVAGDFSIQGGLNVGQNLQASGNLGVNGGVSVLGSEILTGGGNLLGTPTGPVVTCTTTVSGCTTSTSWSYKITATNAYGGQTLASSAGSIAASDGSTLSSTTYNHLTWGAVTGAAGYKIYRTTAGGTPSSTGLVGATTTTSFDDLGYDGDSAVVPTIDSTGQLTVKGSAVFQTSTNSATAFQVQNAAGTNLIVVDTSGPTVSLGVTGGTATASTVNIATGTAATQTINLGSTGSGNAAAGTLVNIQGGTTANTAVTIGTNAAGGITIDTGTTGNINIGNNANAKAIAVGNNQTNTTFTTTTGAVTQTNSNTGVAIQTNTNSTSAFTVKNSGSSNVVSFDTTNATGNNLVANPSFESALSNWTNRGSGSATQVTTVPYEQTHDLSITTTNAANDGASYSTGGSFLANGTTYTLSAYVRTDSTLSQATFEMGHADDGTTPTFVSCLTGQTLTVGWKRFTCTWTSGAITGSPFVYLRKTSSTTNPTIYVDDIVLQTDANATSTYQNASLDLTGTILQGPLVLKDSSNGSTAFQIQNANGVQVFNVDTTDTNLISNPGFEVNSVGWSAVSSATIRRDTTKTYSGIASQVIVINSVATGGTQFSLNPVVTAASTTYVLSFYSLLGSGTAPTFQVTYDPTGSAPTTCSPSGTDVTTGWTRFSCSFSSATTPTTGGFIKIAQTNSNSSTWYIDAVQLEPGSTATSYGAGGITLNGIIQSPTTFQATANSTTAFQIQNSSGNNLLAADTTNGQIILGQSSSLNGTLVFANSGNTNTVTLASGATSASYSLNLPTAAPSTNQCLAASSTTQLAFNSCDNFLSAYSAAGTCNASNITLQFTGTVNSAPSCSSTTLTLPSNTTKLMVEMKGGGGAGGGASNASAVKDAPGGGEGAYLKAYITSVATACTGGTGAQCFYTVGGTATGNTGAVNGNASCFGTNATACTSPIQSAGGGTGGAQATSSAFRAGGAGGTCSGSGTAALCIPGAPGGWALGASPALGGQGGGTGGGAAINASGNGNAAVAASGGGGGGGLLTAAAATTENGGNGGSGFLTFYVYTGSTGADLAEWYDTQSNVSAGDVVAISGKYISYKNSKGQQQQIAVLQKASSTGKALLGVVSTAPNTIMDDGLRSAASHPEPIALNGRVPIKVSLENGPIHAGDLLTISSTPGVAMRLTASNEPIIGQALAEYDGGPNNTVMTFVKTQYLASKTSSQAWVRIVLILLTAGILLGIAGHKTNFKSKTTKRRR